MIFGLATFVLLNTTLLKLDPPDVMVSTVEPLKVTVPELFVKVPELDQLPETLKLPDDVGAVRTAPVEILTAPLMIQMPASAAAVFIVPPVSDRLAAVKGFPPKSTSAEPAPVKAPVFTLPANTAFPEFVILNAAPDVTLPLKA